MFDRIAITGVLLVCLLAAANGQAKAPGVDALELEIDLKDDANVARRGIGSGIPVIFRNKGDRPVRVLTTFEEDSRWARIFFDLHFYDRAGDELKMFGGGGNLDIYGRHTYVELGHDQKYRFILWLDDMIPSNHYLPAGAYTIRLEYFNRYGENCFKGRLSSGSVLINLTHSR